MDRADWGLHWPRRSDYPNNMWGTIWYHYENISARMFLDLVPSPIGMVTNVSGILKSASSAYKGSTVLGHALSKYAGRNPSIWGKLTGNPSSWHSQALKHFIDIMSAPGQFVPKTNVQGIKFLEKTLPDGRGIRLNMDQTFKDLLIRTNERSY